MALLIWSMDCWLVAMWYNGIGTMRFLTIQVLEETPGEIIVEPWT